MIPILATIPSRFLVYGAFAVVVVSSAWYIKRTYDEGKREEGRAELRESLNGTIAQLAADKAAFDKVTESMTTIKQHSQLRQKAVATAAAANAERKEQEAKAIERIDAKVFAGETECERTDSAINELFR